MRKNIKNVVDVKNIIPENELIFCKTCEEFVILTKKHMKRDCKCSRVGGDYKNNWVFWENGEPFQGEFYEY